MIVLGGVPARSEAMSSRKRLRGMAPGDGGGPGPGKGSEVSGCPAGGSREHPGPPPTDLQRVLTLAVLGEENDSYAEVDAHRSMDLFRCYVYDGFGPGIFRLEMARGMGGFSLQPHEVPVVKALVEVIGDPAMKEYNTSEITGDSDSDTDTVAGVIHEIVCRVTVLRRDRWYRWQLPKHALCVRASP